MPIECCIDWSQLEVEARVTSQEKKVHSSCEPTVWHSFHSNRSVVTEQTIFFKNMLKSIKEKQFGQVKAVTTKWILFKYNGLE